MRVTQNMTVTGVVRDLQRALQKLAESEEKVSSGRQWHRPSEDPSAVRYAASYKSHLQRIDQYRKNIDRANARLGYTESSLNEVGNVYTQLKSLAVQAASDTTTEQDRQNIAADVAAIRDHLVQLANTKLEGQYIFSGSQVSTPPYVREEGESVDYRGDSEEMYIHVSDQNTVAFNIPGNEVFGDRTSGIFHTLDVMEKSLLGNDRVGIEWALGQIDEHHEDLLSARARVGARMNYLEITEDSLASAQQQLTSALSQVEDADLTEAVTELSQYENQYQAAASATAYVLKSSLLDYLA